MSPAFRTRPRATGVLLCHERGRTIRAMRNTPTWLLLLVAILVVLAILWLLGIGVKVG